MLPARYDDDDLYKIWYYCIQCVSAEIFGIFSLFLLTFYRGM